jgi:hypothetical protein
MGECPADLEDLNLTTHNTHKREISMPPVGFEPTIPALKRPQTYVTVTGN